MRYTKNHISIHSERNFYHGSAKSNINEQEGKNMLEVCFSPYSHTTFPDLLICIVLTPIVNTSSQTPALKHSTMLSKQSRNVDRTHSFVGRFTGDNIISVPTSPIDGDDDLSVSNSFRIGVIIHRADAGFATRVNTIPSFLEINRRVSPYAYLCRVL